MFEKEIKSFKKNGYSILRNAIPKNEIRQMFRDFSYVFDISLRSLGIKTNAKSCDKKYEILKKSNLILKSHCYDVLGMLDKVQEITNNEKILKFSKSISSSPLCKQSVQIRIDDPSNDRMLPLHQELELLSLLGVAIWIPLVDTNSQIGGLRVVPGSHKMGVKKHLTRDQTKDGYNKVIWNEDKNKIKHLSVKKGDVVVFHPLLFHGSMPNKSKNARWTLVYRLCDIKFMPYLRSEKAKMFMDRNPDVKSPGNEFLSKFLKND